MNFRSHVTSHTVLGANTNFNGMHIVGAGAVEIGDNFHSGCECRMITQIHDYDHGNAIPYGTSYIYKPIRIEDNVWVGDRVIILGGVTIGEGAIIQAGSVVVKDVPKCAIAGGHPAEVFKSRDTEHYEKLKREGKFL
ncbi:acyltransferase [Rubripirellula lacrimiformis]|uniref:acyltransferase n=1 Tax=Rubripirellula lacrimiformis TaxID=1930273 RepID=UPI001FE85749|nr:acyltransferase [Rubripirellula lacrimiformis]